MNDREAKSISDVAAVLRGEIIAGKYSGEDEKGRQRKVPSRNDFRERFGLSPESGGVVLRMLAAEGLIRMEQGRGTFAEPVTPYRVVVTVRPLDASAVTARWSAALVKRLQARADLSDPAVTAAAAQADIAVTVAARDAGYAAVRASAAVRDMLGDGWEITGGSMTERRA
jgi:DNA-binding FadR family transcriptional regulator